MKQQKEHIHRPDITDRLDHLMPTSSTHSDDHVVVRTDEEHIDPLMALLDVS